MKKRDIRYGIDACNYCKMIIVDNKFAAETVSRKGKVLVYDAAECMLNMMNSMDESTIELMYVTDYLTPGSLIDATQAYYIISENVPSPMGDNISAYSELEEAHSMMNRKGGKQIHWEELHHQYVNID